jgi:excisionase family DNA binding protein
MSRFPDELTTKEVAARLGFGQSAVLEWGKRGYLPFRLTPGRHRRYRLADVDAFAAKIADGSFALHLPSSLVKRIENVVPVIVPSKPGRNGTIQAKKKSKPGIKPTSRASK